MFAWWLMASNLSAPAVLLPPTKQFGVAVWQVPISDASFAVFMVAVIGLETVPPETLMLTVTVAPCVTERQLVMPAGVPAGHEASNGERASVVVVETKLPTAADQPLIRFVTFTEPRPVARSNPVAVPNPIVPVGAPTLFTVSSTPTEADPGVVTLQLKLAARHGTELFPFTTSLKTQFDAGP